MKRSDRLLLAATHAIALLGLAAAACGDAGEEVPVDETTEATVVPSPAAVGLTPGVGTTEWRWGDVTVSVPDSDDFHVSQDFWIPGENPGAGRLALTILKGDVVTADGIRSSLVIDAKTGAVVQEDILREDMLVFAAIKASMKTGPLDLSTAGWPLDGAPDASLSRESFGRISFIRPGPETGLLTLTQINDPGGECVGVHNGTSSLGVCADDSGGLLISREHVIAGKDAGFDAWLAEVRLCDVDRPC